MLRTWFLASKYQKPEPEKQRGEGRLKRKSVIAYMNGELTNHDTNILD